MIKIFSIIAIGAVAFTSCNKPGYCTLKINFECTPTIYFDSLRAVVLSNSFSDLDGKGGGPSIFSAPTVFAKNLPLGNDKSFHLAKVRKGSYMYLYVQANLADTKFSGIKRNLDFSSVVGDTAEVTICVNASSRIMAN